MILSLIENHELQGGVWQKERVQWKQAHYQWSAYKRHLQRVAMDGKNYIHLFFKMMQSKVVNSTIHRWVCIFPSLYHHLPLPLGLPLCVSRTLAVVAAS